MQSLMRRPEWMRLRNEYEVLNLGPQGAKSERLSSWGKSGHDYSAMTVKGYLADFYHQLELDIYGSWSPRVGLKVPSNQETETHKWLGFFPQMREWLGARQTKGIPIYSFAITNKLYEATVDIDIVDWRFDKSGEIQMKMAQAGARALQHWELLVSSLIESNGTCYDGLSFFNVAHTFGGTGPAAMSNLLTKSSVPELSVPNPSDPSQTEMAAAIVAVAQQLFTYKDAFNEPINGGCGKIVVMVPPNMHGAAIAAIRIGRLNFGQDNPLQFQNLVYDVIVNPRLTLTSTFYVFREDDMAKPFILQDAIAPQVEFQGEGSYPAFKDHKYLFGVKAMRAAGYGEWSHAIKATFG